MSSTSTAAAKFMRGLSSKAEQLHLARKGVDVLKAKQKREMDAHFEKISRLKSEVLNGLKIVGISSVKVRTGDTYYKARSKRFEYKSEIQFELWARGMKLTRVDREAAKRKLQQLAQKGKVPEFVSVREVDTIAFKKKPSKKQKDAAAAARREREGAPEEI